MSSAAAPLAEGGARRKLPTGGSCSTFLRRSFATGFSSNLGNRGGGAGSGSLYFCSVRANGGGGGATGATGAGGGGDGLLGGGRSSSVGPDKMLANDMGSAALAGFYIRQSLVLYIHCKVERKKKERKITRTASFGGEAGLGGGSRIIVYPGGGPLPIMEYGEPASFLGGDCE